MKRLLAFFSIVLLSYCSQAQDPLQHILKSYFRTHPFEMRFSSFISSLQRDPWFSVGNYNRRTDSTFFFLSGTYKNFNPFRYTSIEVKLVVAEEQFIHADSLKTPDTIINLQLMGITGTGKANEDVVQKEFKRFHRNFSNSFWKSTYDNIQKSTGLIAEIYNYFDYPFTVSPITIAWGLLSETNQYTFTITIRFKIQENQAVRIVSPEGL